MSRAEAVLYSPCVFTAGPSSGLSFPPGGGDGSPSLPGSRTASARPRPRAWARGPAGGTRPLLLLLLLERPGVSAAGPASDPGSVRRVQSGRHSGVGPRRANERVRFGRRPAEVSPGLCARAGSGGRGWGPALPGGLLADCWPTEGSDPRGGGWAGSAPPPRGKPRHSRGPFAACAPAVGSAVTGAVPREPPPRPAPPASWACPQELTRFHGLYGKVPTQVFT